MYRGTSKAIAIIAFFITTATNAIITHIDVAPLADGRELFTLAERHDPISFSDLEQTNGITTYLLKQNQEKKRCHLFVEVPSLFVQEHNGTGKVTTNIIEQVQNLPFITAQNIEVRCASLAAMYALTSKFPMSPAAFNTQRGWCTVGNTTFNDLTKEFEQLATTTNPNFEFLSPTKRFQARVHYEEKIAELARLKKSLELLSGAFGIQPHDSILATAQQRRGETVKEIKQRYGLYWNILDLFGCLFDLYILHRIERCCEQNDPAKIFIIAGSAHTEWINKVIPPIKTAITPQEQGITLLARLNRLMNKQA